MPPKLWPVTRSEPMLKTRVFSLTRRYAVSPRTQREGEFYVFEMPDWVNVIAITDDDQVVMVRQYRHGSQDLTLEIPGGMVDAEDSDPSAAAARELLEETGYEAGEVKLLGSVAPNPALQANRCYTCLATGLRYHGTQQLDANEDIEVLTVPRAQMPELIATGAITHSLVVCAFVWQLGLGASGPGAA
jgi:ADP-ribose pyrophosphatase